LHKLCFQGTRANGCKGINAHRKKLIYLKGIGTSFSMTPSGLQVSYT